MNLPTFNKLMKETEARRHPPEWRMFLELCELYLKQKRIKNPVVVELGSTENNCSDFYEQLLGAKYIDADKLGKKTIDILSISGGYYKDVKKNFDKYSSKCNGIIAIHDIESCRYKKRKESEAWKFWYELKALTACGAKELENFLFISIHRKRIKGNQRGIGVIIKR